MTPLDKTLKRALVIDGHDYVIALTPDVLKITQKGHRLGLELKWNELVRGESALAVALQASVGQFQSDAPAAKKPDATPRQAKSKSPNARKKRKP